MNPSVLLSRPPQRTPVPVQIAPLLSPRRRVVVLKLAPCLGLVEGLALAPRVPRLELRLVQVLDTEADSLIRLSLY